MDNKEDNIRPPDEVKVDKLLDHDFYDFNFNALNSTNTLNSTNDVNSNEDYDINIAIEMSQKEFILLQEQRQKKRLCKFKNLKIQLNKMLSFDKHNMYIYELVLSVIEMYEHCIINEYETYEKEYNDIFKILQTIRLPANEIEDLKKIIIYK